MKKVKETHTFDPPNLPINITVVQTEDDVNYVFRRKGLDKELWFSHRYHPNREPPESHDPTNHRLPTKVIEEIESTGYSIKYLNGMIVPAKMNQKSMTELKEMKQ